MSIQTPGQIPQPESGAQPGSGKRAEAGDPSAADPGPRPGAEPDASSDGRAEAESPAVPVNAVLLNGAPFAEPAWYAPGVLVPAAPAAASPRFLGRVPGDVRAFLGVGIAGVAMGVVVGALWRWISPAIQGVISQGSAYYAAPEGKTFIAQDGWFALLALCAGVLLAVAAFVRCRATGSLGAILGLGAGGVGGGYLAAWFGTYIGPGHGSIQRAVQGVTENATFDLPMQLRSTGVIWLWPAAAAGLYFFLMLLFGPDDPPRAGAGMAGLAPEFWPEAYRAQLIAAEEPAQPAHPAGADQDQVPPPEESADPD
jgi:hypothetical protein